tara:strand:- start:1258 stop:2364 length:1107 start_codon:yes stop_codon:yes gene_type:complete
MNISNIIDKENGILAQAYKLPDTYGIKHYTVVVVFSDDVICENIIKSINDHYAIQLIQHGRFAYITLTSDIQAKNIEHYLKEFMRAIESAVIKANIRVDWYGELSKLRETVPCDFYRCEFRSESDIHQYCNSLKNTTSIALGLHKQKVNSYAHVLENISQGNVESSLCDFIMNNFGDSNRYIITQSDAYEKFIQPFLSSIKAELDSLRGTIESSVFDAHNLLDDIETVADFIGDRVQSAKLTRELKAKQDDAKYTTLAWDNAMRQGGSILTKAFGKLSLRGMVLPIKGLDFSEVCPTVFTYSFSTTDWARAEKHGNLNCALVLSVISHLVQYELMKKSALLHQDIVKFISNGEFDHNRLKTIYANHGY